MVLTDPGPLPHPAASSTDISKIIRADYGADGFYAELAERALEHWERWQAGWSQPLFHRTGFLLLRSGELRPGDYEHDGYVTLKEHGWPVSRVDAETLERYPAWAGGPYVDGYWNPRAGYAESARVMSLLIAEARELGVDVRPGLRGVSLLDADRGVAGARFDDGSEIRAEETIVAAGAWTPLLVPELQPVMWATGQPVMHFRPADPQPYQAERFPVWGADISTTGWYGFPLHPNGTIKIGNHGPGVRLEAGDPRPVEPEVIDACREFLAGSLPGLAGAELESTRLCLYCDTFDGDFWIDRHPGKQGLLVAAGGNGHGFKFVPLLGEIVADVLEGRENPVAARFRWRDKGRERIEQARRPAGAS